MKKLAAALESVGCAGVSIGLFMFEPWVGVTAAGAMSVVFGVALERVAKREEVSSAG